MYRKLTAATIFNGFEFEPENAVLILNNNTVEAIIPASEAGEDVIHFDGILTPGFVNAHCHTELSHLKNKIPKHTGLVRFVQQVLQHRNEVPAEELISSAIQQMYDSGISAVGDICNTSNSINSKKKSDVHFINFLEVSGFIDASAPQRMSAIREVQKLFEEHYLQSTIVPHAPYSVSPALFRLISEISAKKLISIHNQESEAENIFFQNASGEMFELYKNLGIDISFFEAYSKTSLQTWLPYFNDHSIISVHNTFISKEDLHAAKDVAFCICINANLYIENRLPPLQLLLDEKVHIVLGTDSLASNETLNIYDEIKTIQKHFPQIPLHTVLSWATSNGAATLEISDMFGSFKKGMRPGVVQIHDGHSKRIV